jgi:hypothetical protein
VAGKRARAEFRDRAVDEADQLVAELTALSRSARSGDGKGALRISTGCDRGQQVPVGLAGVEQ